MSKVKKEKHKTKRSQTAFTEKNSKLRTAYKYNILNTKTSPKLCLRAKNKSALNNFSSPFAHFSSQIMTSHNSTNAVNIIAPRGRKLK